MSSGWRGGGSCKGSPGARVYIDGGRRAGHGAVGEPNSFSSKKKKKGKGKERKGKEKKRKGGREKWCQPATAWRTGWNWKRRYYPTQSRKVVARGMDESNRASIAAGVVFLLGSPARVRGPLPATHPALTDDRHGGSSGPAARKKATCFLLCLSGNVGTGYGTECIGPVDYAGARVEKPRVPYAIVQEPAIDLGCCMYELANCFPSQTRGNFILLFFL
jgi:hypothetical protein